MLLSRKWLNEFVQVEADDKEFSEAMTLSGSKVENTEVLNASLKNVVAGRIIKLERHPDSDHMWGLSDRRGGSGACSDCHRSLEYPRGGLGPRGQTQLFAPPAA